MHRQSDTGLVTRVAWVCVAQDGEAVGEMRGVVDVGGELITPYEDLTEAQVIGWVKDLFGEAMVQSYEAAATAKLQALTAPSSVTGTPW